MGYSREWSSVHHPSHCSPPTRQQPINHDLDGFLYLQAKQRASILWLLSKACNSDIPSELKEPYYKDHDGEDRLKPQIVHALANSELYCLVLANIYADPNYNHLNHNGIIQVLMRKGIYVTEPHDTSLTETVLVQTAPIKMVRLERVWYLAKNISLSARWWNLDTVESIHLHAAVSVHVEQSATTHYFSLRTLGHE